MAWGTALAAAAPIIGGIMGNVLSSGDRKAAQEALQAGMAELDALGMPPNLSKRIIYEQFQQVGILSPELEQDIDLAESKVSLIKEDPALREAQMEALRRMEQRGKVGFGAEEKLALNKIVRELGSEAEGKRQQILQNFAARGQGGSGAELIASLQASEAGDIQAAEAGDRLAAMKAQAAQQALGKYADMAGQVRSQDFGVEQARAGAADQFNLAQFNAANQRQARNIAAQNQAQAGNLQSAQQIAAANTQMENQERMRMEQAKRDYWKDKLSRASAYMGAGAQSAQASQREADRKAGMFAGIGSGIGQGIGAYNQQISQEEQNELNRQNALDVARIRYK